MWSEGIVETDNGEDVVKSGEMLATDQDMGNDHWEAEYWGEVTIQDTGHVPNDCHALVTSTSHTVSLIKHPFYNQ